MAARVELQALKKITELKKEARLAGVDMSQVDAAIDDEEDVSKKRDAIIELIVNATALGGGVHGGPPPVITVAQSGAELACWAAPWVICKNRPRSQWGVHAVGRGQAPKTRAVEIAEVKEWYAAANDAEGGRISEVDAMR